MTNIKFNTKKVTALTFITIVLLFLFYSIFSITSWNYNPLQTYLPFYPKKSNIWYKGKERDFNFQLPVPPPLPSSASFVNSSFGTLSTSTKSNLNSTSTNLTKSAFVILCRESDLIGILDSIRSIEDRFNQHYHYPYIFLSETSFSSSFKSRTSFIASGLTSYGLINSEQWGDNLPDGIDVKRMEENMDKMSKESIPYASNLNYRKMCRYQAGFFFRHPLLQDLDYYWRIEPNVKFHCDISYDPFHFMQENDLKYGFVISLKEYEATIPTLWNTTKDFMKSNPQYLSYPNSLDFISPDAGETYNLCHFWSNFEIASLSLWRSENYLAYFDFLDKAGGFFEERWGDAPVHSIAASLFLKPEEIHFFEDIGYRHDPFSNCPADKFESCDCNPNDSFDKHWYSCTNSWKKFRTWS